MGLLCICNWLLMEGVKTFGAFVIPAGWREKPENSIRIPITEGCHTRWAFREQFWWHETNWLIPSSANCLILSLEVNRSDYVNWTRNCAMNFTVIPFCSYISRPPAAECVCHGAGIGGTWKKYTTRYRFVNIYILFRFCSRGRLSGFVHNTLVWNTFYIFSIKIFELLKYIVTI